MDHQVIEENDGHDTMHHQNNNNNDDEFNLQSSPIFIQSDDGVPLETNNINRISTAVMDSPSHQGELYILLLPSLSDLFL